MSTKKELFAKAISELTGIDKNKLLECTYVYEVNDLIMKSGHLPAQIDYLATAKVQQFMDATFEVLPQQLQKLDEADDLIIDQEWLNNVKPSDFGPSVI